MRVAEARIHCFLKIRIRKWAARIRLQKKTKIANFIVASKEQPHIFSIMTLVYKRILVAQRTIKLFLKRKKLMYAFNCKNWVLKEVETLNQAKKSETRRSLITHIELANMTKTPPQIKLLYIREYFKVSMSQRLLLSSIMGFLTGFIDGL